MSRIYQVNGHDNLHSHLGTNVLTEQFLQGNVRLRILLNEETLLLSEWSLDIVNPRGGNYQCGKYQGWELPEWEFHQ